MSSDQVLLWEQNLPLIRLTGEGSRTFLHGQTTGDFKQVEEGSLFHCCWLTATGQFRALLEVRVDCYGADLVVLAGDNNALIKGFDQVIFPADKVKVERKNSIRRLQILSSKECARFNNITWLLLDEVLPTHLESAKKVSQEKLDRWILDQGLPISLGGGNFNSNPFELGLTDVIDLDKGCYLGQETMAKLARAGFVKQQLRVWSSDSNILVGQSLTRPKAMPDKVVGTILSSMRDTMSGKNIGFAMVRRQALEERELSLYKGLEGVSISIPLGFVQLEAKH